MREEPKKAVILIVDDATDNLDVLKAVLMESYQVRLAIQGELALRLARMIPQPDLILLDIVMPGMNGFEVCRRLKANPQTADIPVIFVTARTDEADELEGLQLGAVDYLTKPVNPAIVRARISTHLAVRRLQTQLEDQNRRLYDINEQLNESLQQLSASEERFRGLVQTVPDIVFKIDAEGNFTFLNRSIERLGYHPSELIGQHFTAIIDSADVPTVSLNRVIDRIGAGTCNPEQKVFDERRTGTRLTLGLELHLKPKHGISNQVYELRDLDPPKVPVEVNSTGLYGAVGEGSSQPARRYIGSVGVIRDVTDRRQAQKALLEERLLLRQLIDTVPLPIFFIEGAGTLLFANSAFLDFAGQSAEQLSGKGLDDLFRSEGKRRIARLYAEFQADAGARQLRREIEWEAGPAHIECAELRLVKFVTSEQEPPAIIGILVDLTELKNVQHHLLDAKRHAEAMARSAKRASQAKGEFLANMSHEIRTPLNAVIGLTQLCLQSDLTVRQRDYLATIATSAGNLLQLINDILDFSRIESVGLSLADVEFPFARILDALVALGIPAQKKGLEYLIEVGEGVPQRLRGDEQRLGQVLHHLVDNAIKFTERGAVHIGIGLRDPDTESVELEFAIRDTGIGMPADQIEEMFAEFSQGDGSSSRKHGGTGLGLAISGRLVGLMAGQIRVESAVNEGSCFRFTARFATVDGRDEPEGEDGERCGVRILIVDDHPWARQILVDQVRALGHQADAVANGPEALERIQGMDAGDDFVELVLMDQGMPGMSGLEATCRIKTALALRHPPKIILLTTPGQENLLSLDGNPGGNPDGFLGKPLLTDRLAFTLHQQIERCQEVFNVGGEESGMLVRLSGVRVLLVEDDLINQEVGRELLSEAGVEVTLACDGAEAVAKVTDQPFDLVLMDVMMPVMDGYEAAQMIRHQKGAHELPIIAMTAGSMPDDRQRCLNAGMNDHLTKPVVPGELWAMLAKWSGRGPAEADTGVTGVKRSMVVPDPGIGLQSGREIDVAVGMKNVGGRIATFRSVLGKFVKNQADACQRLERLWNEGDFVEMERIAHTLKGSAALIGARRMSELAKRIEQVAKTPREATEVSELLEESTTELKHLVAAIQAGLNEGKEESNALETGDPEGGRMPEALAGLMREADELLRSFDSSVEQVVESMKPFARDRERRERIRGLQETLADYDFDGCLAQLQIWAQAEQIDLKGGTE
ncbi:MAG: response regulator [Magnetococcus sp. YQC-9]